MRRPGYWYCFTAAAVVVVPLPVLYFFPSIVPAVRFCSLWKQLCRGVCPFRINDVSQGGQTRYWQKNESSSSPKGFFTYTNCENRYGQKMKVQPLASNFSPDKLKIHKCPTKHAIFQIRFVTSFRKHPLYYVPRGGFLYPPRTRSATAFF